jgi:DNA replication protein DnaC
VDLVIADELGYIGLGSGGPLLFQFCAELYEKSSLIITTNLEFSRWAEVFDDAVLTGALLESSNTSFTHSTVRRRILPIQAEPKETIRYVSFMS